jgi:hypothetical protein
MAESTLMMAHGHRETSSTARSVFPVPVGPIKKMAGGNGSYVMGQQQGEVLGFQFSPST